MANEVVIGNLADDKRDDCLRFGGSGDYTVTDAIDMTGAQTITSVFVCDELKTQAVHSKGGGHYRLVILGTGKLMVNSEVTNATITCGVVNTVSVVFDSNGKGISLTLNGVVEWTGLASPSQLTTDFYIGARNTSGTLGLFFSGKIHSVVIQGFASYVQNGDFGSSTLIDHSGNGNDGTIVGAQWWKKDVDQAFADPLTYRSQLPATPVEVQHVTYTDKTQPYYPTGDAFWGLYTPTWLTVASLGGNVYLLRQSGLNYSLSMGL